jgi:hypothetical protein
MELLVFEQNWKHGDYEELFEFVVDVDLNQSNKRKIAEYFDKLLKKEFNNGQGLTYEGNDAQYYTFTVETLDKIFQSRSYALGTEDGLKHYLFPESVKVKRKTINYNLLSQFI